MMSIMLRVLLEAVRNAIPDAVLRSERSSINHPFQISHDTLVV